MSGDLCILTQDPRFGGGALAQIEAFWEAAARLGRRPEIAYARRPPVEYDLSRSPVRGHEARVKLARVDAIGVPQAARRLTGVAREARSLWVVSTIAYYGSAAPRTGRPYACWIGTTLGPEWEARRGGLSLSRRATAAASIGVLRRIERRVLRGATCLYAMSPSAQVNLAHVAGVDACEVRLLRIPIDLERCVPLGEDEWQLALQHPTIVFAGRADDPRKNVGLLLAAFEHLREKTPELRLRLVGRPPAGRLPAGVEATGEVPDVGHALRGAAVMVLPSLQEGFGIVVAEALACGVPVVTTPCGGPEEIVRASGGGTVLSGFDPDELAATLNRLIGDTDTLTRMRASGRRYVEQVHSPAVFQASLGEALRELDDAH